MAFFKSIMRNMGQISKQVLPGSPVGNQEVGLASLDYSTQQEPGDREAIYPNWFFSARLGQPRRVDTRKLRVLAQSPWVQMVTTTFKKQIETIPWEVVAEDEEDDANRDDDIKTCTEFFKNMNPNKQTVNDVNSELITDVAEIDAGCLNYVYTNDSYVIGEVPVHNAWGRVISFDAGLVLKPLGQRELSKIKSVDGSTMLKQVDIHKDLLNYWQYSFKHPRQNPTRFEVDEIGYVMMNPKSYDVYGFAPTQSIQQVVELLIQGTRYNKDLYTNNAVPDIIASLPKLPKDQLRKIKRGWNNQYKGKPHQVGFINWAIDKIMKLNDTNRDLEWLEGQRWYFKIVFGAYGVSSEEAGFFENANKSNDEGQEKVTVRNALKPYMQKIEQLHTQKSITEILGREDHGLKFKFFPKDHAVEKIEFEQSMQELDHGTMTINEFRKLKGAEPVEWGDDPLRRPFDPTSDFTNFGGDGNPIDPNPQQDPNDPNNPNKKHIHDVSPHEMAKDRSNRRNEVSIFPTFKNSSTPKTGVILDAGEDILLEADDYSDFLLKYFDLMEKKVLSAANSIEIEKVYMSKTLGEFLRGLFNSVNTVVFAKTVKRFIKADLLSGLSSAEAELGMDIGFTSKYDDRLNQLTSQQIDGYTINGKKWFGIKGATKEIQAKVIQTVQAGIKEKAGIDVIKENISKDFNNFSDWRSEMIARTETTRIVNEGKIVGYKESGLEGRKVWNTAIDDRTSPICRRLNNQTVELDNDFIDPETRKAYPTPPAHPNCRSTIHFKPN